ncbi:MAG: hypothetical protein JNM84_01565 [Planctomycetes bacterium]|nr:hypothetical protein [Planctomycetota bacterium]
MVAAAELESSGVVGRAVSHSAGNPAGPPALEHGAFAALQYRVAPRLLGRSQTSSIHSPSISGT